MKRTIFVAHSPLTLQKNKRVIMPKLAVLLVAANLWAVTFTRPAAAAAIDQQQVVKAIDRGVAYLKRSQSPRGTWADLTSIPGGISALCTLALLNAGVPVDDPAIEQALAALRNTKPTKTYSVALQTMVFCAAEPAKDMVLIQRNVRWLEQTQIQDGDGRGAWSYPGMDPDNSNSQFALLGLHEAERVGVKVRDATWRLAADYWQRTQNPDGSWGYNKSRPNGTGSMICAGIAGLVITRGRVTRGDAAVIDGQVNCCMRRQAEDDALPRALAWLGRSFSVQRNPGGGSFGAMGRYYYLYGVERVGRMTAHRFIGGHDWYREGAAQLLRDQDGLNGSWKGHGYREDNPQIATSLALLFLAKGRRPVVVAKVQHGPGEDWNNHRRDLANLTAYTEQCWKKDLTWQVVDPAGASVEDLLQMPVLFISGRQTPEFSRAIRDKLRAYLDRGGFVFADACCQGDAFDRGFRQLMDQVFPEPEYRLRPLPPAHPIWRAQQRVDPNHLRPLWGIDYGCRTCVVYCPKDLSCYWELSRSGRDATWPAAVQKEIEAANAIGVNVLTYATGGEPEYKDAAFNVVADTEPAEAQERGTIAIAKLVHPGGCNEAPGALANLLRAAGSQLQLRIDTRDRLLKITDPDLFRYHMVFMHGRRAFRLTPAERKQLASYVERGGTLLADAICASKPFATSFRREMAAIFPDHPLARIPSNHPLLTDAFGGYDITTVRRQVPRQTSGDKPLLGRTPKGSLVLEGIEIDGHYNVIFSPYDLSCALEKYESFECEGYARQDAARIGLNVLMYSLAP
jgi:hypothetical protein